MENILFYALLPLLLTLIMTLLNKGATQNGTLTNNGEFELRMNRFYQVLGFICLAIPIFLIVSHFNNPEENMLFFFLVY